jgi:hypothetical protein
MITQDSLCLVGFLCAAVSRSGWSTSVSCVIPTPAAAADAVLAPPIRRLRIETGEFAGSRAGAIRAYDGGMRKIKTNHSRRLSLPRETLRQLTTVQLAGAMGGLIPTVSYCHASDYGSCVSTHVDCDITDIYTDYCQPGG